MSLDDEQARRHRGHARRLGGSGLEPTGAVERAVAIHISTEHAANTIALRPGARVASAAAIRATVRGRGGGAKQRFKQQRAAERRASRRGR